MKGKIQNHKILTDNHLMIAFCFSNQISLLLSLKDNFVLESDEGALQGPQRSGTYLFGVPPMPLVLQRGSFYRQHLNPCKDNNISKKFDKITRNIDREQQ